MKRKAQLAVAIALVLALASGSSISSPHPPTTAAEDINFAVCCCYHPPLKNMTGFVVALVSGSGQISEIKSLSRLSGLTLVLYRVVVVVSFGVVGAGRCL